MIERKILFSVFKNYNLLISTLAIDLFDVPCNISDSSNDDFKIEMLGVNVLKLIKYLI